MIKLPTCALAVFWFLGVAIAAETPAAPPPDFEKSLRAALSLPDEIRLIYRDENGAPLTAEQAAHGMQSGKVLEIAKDEVNGTATLTLADRPASQPEDSSVTRLPAFDLRDLNGRRLRNSDLAGRPTLINFFFETCVPCIKEAPVLNDFRRKHPHYHYLAVTPDGQAEAQRFAEQHKFEWPIAFEGDVFIEALKVKGYPTYLLVAADGRILGRGSGMDTRDMADPARALAELERWVAARLSTSD